MNMKNLISANEFCANHNIEISFISSLQKIGLIEITTIHEIYFIHASQLRQLEKIVHLYYELNINLEGIETINYLLQRMNNMHDEITMLKNQLRLYQGDE